MKIYFAGSIRGGREDKNLYSQIIKNLQKYGTVLTEHIGDQNLTDSGEDLSDKFIYERDLYLIKESDIVVAEVTQPSLGVGYEIGKAEELGKKILCLYRENNKRISAMISGNENLVTLKYNTLDELFKNIKDFFRS
jgi:nucleoside 2-deoxyribosyltransferase